MTDRFLLEPVGPFSLAASIRFLEGFTPAGYTGEAPLTDDPHLHLAFPAEGDWRTVGVCVRQTERRVVGQVVGDADHEAVRAQVARLLSLDVDGAGFDGVGRRDPVVGGLQGRYPGLRPVGFWSPYEAAAWAVMSNRVRITQAAAAKQRVAEQLGETVEVDGERVTAFPPPAALQGLSDAKGLSATKVQRLHAVAEAALDGWLDGAALRGLPREEALAQLRSIPGIGPFGAELVLLRGACDPDAFPTHERRLRRAMAQLYDLRDPDLDTLGGIAETWRPYRTWVAVLIRTWLEDTTHEIAGGR